MPRDGSGVYSAPAGTTAVPNTPIESAKYNALVNDLVQDANTARPVTAGGTGQTSSSLPDTWTVHDPSDDTKKARLDAGNVTAGQTRVFAVPNYDGVIAAESKATNIASASTVNLASATGSLVHITGTTTITALGTVAAGRQFTLVFDGVLTLTHNATSLILPGAANIVTAAGVTAVVVSEGSGNWRMISYNANQVPFTAGTFTPALNFNGGTTGIAYSSRAGQYMKIGRLVTIWIRIVLSSKGSSGGAAQISGLPFANDTTTLPYAAGTVGFFSGGTVTAGASCYVNGSQINLTQGTAAGFAGMTDTNIGNTTEMILSVTYPTSA